MTGRQSLPEVETYLAFAAIQRQQHCQEILSAIDTFQVPSKKKFTPGDVQNVVEDLKANLFLKVKLVLEKDALATAAMLTNTLAAHASKAGDRGHIHVGESPPASPPLKVLSPRKACQPRDTIAARRALKDIQFHHQNLVKRVEQFRADLEQQGHTP